MPIDVIAQNNSPWKNLTSQNVSGVYFGPGRHEYSLTGGQGFSVYLKNNGKEAVIVSGKVIAKTVCGNDVSTSFSTTLQPGQESSGGNFGKGNSQTGVVTETDCKGVRYAQTLFINRIKDVVLENIHVNALYAKQQPVRGADNITQNNNNSNGLNTDTKQNVKEDWQPLTQQPASATNNQTVNSTLYPTSATDKGNVNGIDSGLVHEEWKPLVPLNTTNVSTSIPAIKTDNSTNNNIAATTSTPKFDNSSFDNNNGLQYIQEAGSADEVKNIYQTKNIPLLILKHGVYTLNPECFVTDISSSRKVISGGNNKNKNLRYKCIPDEYGRLILYLPRRVKKRVAKIYYNNNFLFKNQYVIKTL